VRHQEARRNPLDAMRAGVSPRQQRRRRWLERDDPRRAAAGLQRFRHSCEHAARADRAAERM
jgi:hypothetical protein